ncbi:MAG: hypothetical protein ACXVB0_04610 [Mucilaginibacter sp.]
MASPLNTIEIPGMIQKQIVKKIVFADSGLSVEKPWSFDPRVFIPGESISAFRFGIQEMHLGSVKFCREYFIETRDFQNQVFRIKLNSYFGIKGETYYNAWSGLLQRLWDFYLVNQLSYYTELFNIQQMFEIAGVTFHADGISWDKGNKLKWNEIVVSNFPTHFIIHHINNPNQSKCCVFAVHWNAVIVQSLLKDVIKQPVKIRKSSST